MKKNFYKLFYYNMLRNCILAFALFISGSLFAQSQKELGHLMRERGEYYFTLTVQQPSEIQKINGICSVDGTDGTNVVCYANQKQYDNLIQAGYKPTLQTPPSLREEAKMWDGNRATYEWDSYPTYEQYESMMQAFPTSTVSGRSCTYMELGTLNSGRKIMGVRINDGNPEGKPKFLYSSTIHGDETTGMILLLRLIDELCTSNDSRIVNLVSNLDIFIFPDANPDGTYYGGNNTVTGSRRANANGVDMNRNYADPHSSEHPDGNAYQSETQWFMQLAEDYPFVMGANFHGGAEVMNYPWDNTSTRHADDAWWQYISAEYVANTRAVYSGYMTDTYSSGITNGADWYTIGGGRQDYMNGYCQCREITIECSTTKTLGASQLNNYWNYNHVAMLAFMEQCENGIHGIVKDANTQDPIDGATITVQNHDDEYSIVSSHEVGDFHRPIKGGTWTLEIAKSGYHTETVQVTVADDNREDIVVNLRPIEPGEMECYDEVLPTAAGSYVMGYLNETTLVAPIHNNSNTVTTASVTATATDNGFSVETETTVPHITLLANNTTGQYYIQYNSRYLVRSTSGTLSWSTTTSNGSWTITSTGMYITRNSNSYYLYYDNGFKLSTTQHNNIKFYVEGECANPNVLEETFMLDNEWNWWSPNVAISLADFESALGDNGVTITNQAGKYSTYYAGKGTWVGTLQQEGISVGSMYKVKTNQACEVTVEGTIVDPAEYPITINPGINWIGFIGTEEMNLSDAFAGFTPTNLDYVKTSTGTSSYYAGYGWLGSVKKLKPGEGFMYISRASESKTFTYPSSTK